MKTNKLGIAILDSKYYIQGHSIVKRNNQYCNNIFYYRSFRSNNPYTSHLYGITIIKRIK